MSCKELLTYKEKIANDKQWFKDKIDFYDTELNFFSYNNFNLHTKMRVNYDLYNNILNKQDFEYVIKPYGDNIGDLPADFNNKDIISTKIKSIVNIESKRPFKYQVYNVNKNATTLKEQTNLNNLKKYVHDLLLYPIILEIEKKYAEQFKNKELTEEELAQIQQKIDEEIQKNTPQHYSIYFARNNQEPDEVLGNQILNYLSRKLNIKQKFKKSFFHGTISGISCIKISLINNKPYLEVLNPLFLNFERKANENLLENLEWVNYTYIMSPSKIIEYFSDELTKEQIEKIYESYKNSTNINYTTFDERFDVLEDGIQVLHVEFKSLKLIKFLYYFDENNEIQTKIVSEDYKLNKEIGDIHIEEKWIPYVYEGYKIKISEPIYVCLREVPNQYKNLDNLYYCPLSYCGIIYENVNSEITSIVDRLKVFQYFYNILMYRLELLVAADKGKWTFMNVNLIPKSKGMDLHKFLEYLEKIKIGFFNPNEEGNRGGEQQIPNSIKEVDMTTLNQVINYVNLLNYIEQKASDSIGLPKALEGQITENELVGNVNQKIINSNNILDHYFEEFNFLKERVLTRLLEYAKIGYSIQPPESLDYILDDMTKIHLTINPELLENSEYGIFVNNSSKDYENFEIIKQYSHAALQNSAIELSDFIKILNSDTTLDMKEILEQAEEKRKNYEKEVQIQKEKMQLEILKQQREFEKEKHEMGKEKIILKEEKRKETELIKQAIFSLGFNKDKDADNDGQLDIIELLKQKDKALIDKVKVTLEEKDIEYKKEIEDKKLQLKEKELELKEKEIKSKSKNKENK